MRRKCSHFAISAWIHVRRRMPSGSAVRRWELVGTYCRECKRFYPSCVIMGRYSVYIRGKKGMLVIGIAIGYTFILNQDMPKAMPGPSVPLQRCNHVPKIFRNRANVPLQYQEQLKFKPLPIYCEQCSSRMIRVKGQEPYCINRFCKNFRKVE